MGYADAVSGRRSAANEGWIRAMCRQVTCKVCKKATWAGCGQHKNEVLRGVPKNQRCSCTAADKEAARKNSFWGRIFG